MICIICKKEVEKVRKDQKTCGFNLCIIKNKYTVKRERNKLYQRLWRKNNIDKKMDYERKYLKINPNKIKAHKAVFIAKKNNLIKKLPCETCGNKKSVAHHFKGYEKSNWLVVQWLCTSHHRYVHINMLR